MFDAMVLAAGFGTRLRPLTEELPKPMLPVGHRPLLRRILEKLHEEGARNLAVNAHHLPERIAEKTNAWAATFDVFVEPHILGTAGGISGAKRAFGGLPVVLVNGDILGEIPVRPLLAPAWDGLLLAVTSARIGEGTVGIGSEGQVVRLRGETFGEECRSGDYMGMARLGPDCLDTLPKEGCLVGDWALPTLRRGGRVMTCDVETDFRDIGTPESYLAANLEWLADGGQGVDAGAQVAEGIEVVDSVISAGAVVEGRGAVTRSVVMAGARAVAPLLDCTVLPSGRVVPCR